MISTSIALLALLTLVQDEPEVSSPEVLLVGHVIEVRGTLESAGHFAAQKIELEDVDADDALLGTVTEGSVQDTTFVLLGQHVEWDEATTWKGLDVGKVAGQRVKVEGTWKGPGKFRADSIEVRSPGRDRIAARIDALTPTAEGWEAHVMIFKVVIAKDVEVEHAKALAEYKLAPARKFGVVSDERVKIQRDEDDSFGNGFALSEHLELQGQLEMKPNRNANYDLNDTLERDRNDLDLSARVRLAWSPSEKLAGVFELRYAYQFRRDENSGDPHLKQTHSGALGETWLQWRDVFDSPGFDVTVGRQDFDDPREWIFDQNLDALRLTWIRPSWRLDLASAISLNSTERDEASSNAIAYLSNNDQDRHLAVWSVYRDFDQYNGDNGPVPDEKSWHVGARAIGDWLPDCRSWADFAVETGTRPLFDVNGTATGVDADVSAWGYELGTTWEPGFAEPLYFTWSYALGSGDGNPGSSDSTFRQTGWQDNTDRFGGVTSLQYYGELFNPELSNLGIMTLGVGAIVAEKTSLDVLFHTYTQDEASAEFSPLPAREANLKSRPNGLDADLGWELDLILGYRRIKNWDIEVVAATFEPGDGFNSQDTAYYGKLQLRYRF